MNIEEQVHEIIVEHLGVEPNDLSDAKTWQDIGADSMDEVEIQMSIEADLGVDLPDDIWADKLRTVGALVDYLEEELA